MKKTAWPCGAAIVAAASLAAGTPKKTEPTKPATKPTAQTWDIQLAAKLYIAKIDSCGDPLDVISMTQPFEEQVIAAASYEAFCQSAKATFHEDPKTPAISDPLDARIAGSIDLSVTCEPGKAVPIAPSAIKAGPTAAGYEGSLHGTVNPPAIEDHLAKDGTFIWVMSGRPHPVAELPFTLLHGGPRLTPNIWSSVQGKVTCPTAAGGEPTIIYYVGASPFPSIRVWRTIGSDTKVTTVGEGPFTDLWALPLPPKEH
jgi:hypothetical protein